MALKNIKNHGCSTVTRNLGILDVDQIQIETRAAVPTDADLANGRLVYITGTGLRAYIGGSWTTLGAGAGGVSTWDSMYDADKTLSVDDGTMTFAGATALGAGDVITISAAAAVTGDCLQFSNSGSGSDVKGSSVWSISKVGVAVFAGITGTSLTSATNLALNATGAGTIAIGSVSTGAVTITPALVAVASVTITGVADTNVLVITDGDMLVSNGLISIDSDDTTTGQLVIPSSACTTGNPVNITADDLTDGAALYIDSDNGASFTNDGGFIRLYNGAATVWAVGNDGATRILTSANSTVGLLVSGIQTNEDLVRFSTNGVTATGQSTLEVTAAGATAAGSAVLLVNHTGVPAASTSYLAVFDYETATEATNDPITVEIRSGTSVGAALNIIDKATSATGGVLNFTVAELTSGVGINMQSLAALDTGQAINIAHATSVIADTGSLIRATSSGINTGGTTNGTVLDLKTTGQLAGTMCRIDSIQTTGTVLSVISTGIMTTTGNLVTLTANAATTGAGLLRINCNGLTSGLGFTINSSSNALTTGRLFTVIHTGTSGTNAICSEFASALADEGVIVKVTGSGALALGAALQVSAAALTTGTIIDVPGVVALTTGVGLKIVHTTSVIADTGSLIRVTSSGVNTGGATNGTMLDIKGTGQLAGIESRFDSIITTGTVISVIGTGVMTTTGNLLTLTGNAATTAAGLLRINANALTDGIGLTINSSSTAMTANGRLFTVISTGATGTSSIKSEFASNATDETVICKVTASAALAAGAALQVSAVAMTTGTALDFVSADALTTGVMINVHSNSADNTARDLIHIHNDNAAATNATPITIVQDGVTSTHFYRALKFNSNTLWIGDGTTANAALAATTGDILINGGTNKPEYCTNGAGSLWTALV